LSIRDEFDTNDHPIDVLWNDLDYMVDYQDFTLQKEYKAEEMNQLTDMTNEAGARDGLQRGIFLQSSVYDHPLIACVWPGSVYFPDFNQ
jgi:alpha-glucosidase (family GH31 glycosyl hydrolase)